MPSRAQPILWSSGRSQAGARAALSHSGSLVGEDQVYDAAFRRAGLLRVGDSREMRDAIHALAILGEMRGPRLGVVTVTGVDDPMIDGAQPYTVTVGGVVVSLTNDDNDVAAITSSGASLCR